MNRESWDEKSESEAAVIHELGRAWLISYMMNQHNSNFKSKEQRAPWIEEGLSDYIAYLWDPRHMEKRLYWVIEDKFKKAVRPPLFDDFITFKGFYSEGDPALNHWLAALLMKEILGPRESGGTQIMGILDHLANDKNPVAAIERVTGKNPREEYKKLVGKYIKN